MIYPLFKAIHIIGFVSWFAGMFYLVRLFVYHKEAWETADETSASMRKQYSVMESRLYSIIQTPAMVLTWIGGIFMLVINPDWLQQPWMQVKLTLIVLLTVYHFTCAAQIKKLRVQAGGISSFGFRLYNEVPTLILIAVVLLAVFKSLSGLWYAVGVLLLLGVLFFIAAKLYKRKRKR